MTESARHLAILCVLALMGGCAQAVPPAGGGTPDPIRPPAAELEPGKRRLPALLEELGLSEAQRQRLEALRAELELQLEPMQEAGRELALAVAKTVRRCEGSSPALPGAISWAVGSGEQARGAVLDAVDRLHAILTRSQREALVARLRGDEERSKDPRPTDEQARSVGESLDLSLSQLMTMLVRVGALRDALEERIAPWRGQAKSVLAAFVKDDFAIRDHAIAQAPFVALATELLRDGLRTLLPILKPEQCQALATEIERALAEYDERDARDDRPAPP